jgi:glycosyltransferase involved in cell wall biosynthesis
MSAPANFKVTVITVVKNAEKVIPALFASVRQYKTAEVEFIVLDGVSTDGTVDLIKQNEDIVDAWLSEPDKGIYDAMNKAVKMARGQWLLFMGADDELLEGFGQIVPMLKDADTIYYGKVFFHNAVVTGRIENDYRLTKTNICHQAIFYPKSVFDKYTYDTQYVKCADYVLNLNLWDDKDFNFVYCDCLVANFPEGGFSTHMTDDAFERDKDSLFKQHLKPGAYYHYLYKKGGVGKVLQQLLFNK